jgi:peptide/nickel transport system permease protein
MSESTTLTGRVAAPPPAPARRGKPGLGRRLLALPRGLTVGAALLAVFVVVAVFAPLIAPYDPFSLHPPLTPPNSDYLFGTDSLGHDVWSNVVYGARVSLTFAFGAALVSFVLGVVIGAIPTFFGRWIDDLASRIVEIFLMIPSLFLIITAVALVGAHIVVVVVIVGATIWPANAKIMRAQVLTIKRREYVDAGRVGGLSSTRILFRHIIPNGLGPVIANSSLQMAFAVLTEAGLSFLGLGDPNQASWGQLLNNGQSYLDSAPWIVLAPGVALVLLLLIMHSVGDGIGKLRGGALRGVS